MKNKRNNELAVCGFAAVRALEQHIEKISRLYFTADRAPAFGNLCRTLSQRKIPYNQVASPEELQKLCGSIHHQGAVAMIEAPELGAVTGAELSAWAAQKEKALFLDRIGNANNFGAIVRSAAFFGFSRIVIPEDEQQAMITTSAYRVAEGGMEQVSVYTVLSATAFLEGARRWFVRVGSDARGVVPVREARKEIADNSFILILGNEEDGLSFSVRRHCDILAAIPSPAPENNIDSLNVAQAASVLMYELSL
ncbi:MAG: RNA methyltransferase [Treponema sp.]|jgi:TrmH RNA methyltransferase|nr:RNA methyltransferase [Treponema sp.]